MMDRTMMERCAQICHECQDVCLEAVPHSLDLGGSWATREHQTLLADCIAICGVSHNLLHRQSPQHTHTCRACAEICHTCADECDRMARGDRLMQECADACRRCAESCDRMAAARA